MKTLSKVMEMFWLLLGIAGLCFAIYLWSQSSFEEAKMWFLFPAIGFGMYFFRKFMNRKLATMAANEEKRRAQKG